MKIVADKKSTGVLNASVFVRVKSWLSTSIWDSICASEIFSWAFL
jgi:hypothetical protein